MSIIFSKSGGPSPVLEEACPEGFAREDSARAGELPNLLVISQQIPESGRAGSLLLQRLLEHYPAERLLVVGPAPDPRAERLDCRYQTLGLPLQRLNRTRLSRLVRSLRAVGLMPTFGTGAVEKLLGDFRPEMVLTVMEEHPYYHLAYRFARAHGLPLGLLIFDLPGIFEKVYGWARGRQRRLEREVYRSASKRLCVSPEMSDYLNEEFGVTGDVLYPKRSEKLTPRPLAETRQLKQPGLLTVGYAGTTAYGRGPQLHDMMPAFREAGACLRVYSGDDWTWGAADVVTYCGYAPPDETWAKIKRQCDAVILPYCWPDNERYRDLYKTSFPSKLPEYLALGMPILMVGPEYVAGIKWGLRHEQAALVVTGDDPAQWAAALRQLKESAALREQLGRRALEAGARDFDPAVIQRQFINYLKEAGAASMP
ncbi:MAG TPA: glycosyltransferase [Pyrinomonadaceae bacterium]|jgi:glycosyltransferase involved in cell wall biosynthesis